MFNKLIKEIHAEYQAEEQFLPSIQNLIRETCINAGMTRKDATAVTLAIEEGVTNIIRHAYLYEKGLVRIRIVIYQRRIVFSLMDTGRPFQPHTDTKLDLKKLVESGRKGGLGFYMISKIMDSVEYISAPGFNELRMTKLISRQPEKARLFMGRMFTLRVKFSVYTFVIMLTIIAGAYILINERSVKGIREHLHDTVTALSKTVAAQASGFVLNRRSDVEFDELAISYIEANPELIWLVITDSSGNILADTRDIRNLHKKYEPPENIDRQAAGVPQKFGNGERELYYLYREVKSGEMKMGGIHMVYSGEQYLAEINAERQRIIFLTLIGLAIGIGGIYLLSNYFVSPIVRITERVRKFSSGDIETELPLEGVEEYFEISKALNEMMSRLRRDRENIIERERVAKEIEVAGQIQKMLLPGKLPEVPGLQLDAYYRAASRIGGDLYDVFPIDQRHYCLLVADVSGKGIPASLVMSVLRTVIKTQAKGKETPHAILEAVNNFILDDIPPGIFITICLGVFNSENRTLNFVSAGHNPLLYFKNREKKVELINPSGVPLGLPLDRPEDFGLKLREQAIELQDGDIVFIYTDGITESMSRTGEKYGMERLLNLFREQVAINSSVSPKEVTALVLEDIDRHAGMAVQNDDITFIALKCCPPVKAESELRVEIEKHN